MKKVVITYGTFDLFHVGHLRLLYRLKSLGDYLVVAVSTDEFNSLKGKKTVIKFEERFEIINSLKCVDLVVPENSWDQKEGDIKKYSVSTFGMGADWVGKFDFLKSLCDVVYLPRTDGISSTAIKSSLAILDKDHVNDLKNALDTISNVIEKLN